MNVVAFITKKPAGLPPENFCNNREKQNEFSIFIRIRRTNSCKKEV